LRAEKIRADAKERLPMEMSLQHYEQANVLTQLIVVRDLSPSLFIKRLLYRSSSAHPLIFAGILA
jgi:hypothetical protein